MNSAPTRSSACFTAQRVESTKPVTDTTSLFERSEVSAGRSLTGHLGGRNRPGQSAGSNGWFSSVQALTQTGLTVSTSTSLERDERSGCDADVAMSTLNSRVATTKYRLLLCPSDDAGSLRRRLPSRSTALSRLASNKSPPCRVIVVSISDRSKLYVPSSRDESRTTAKTSPRNRSPDPPGRTDAGA